jgi:CheY-like chemotaxis protein
LVNANDSTGTNAPGDGRRRVLVADDSESYRRVTRGQLVARGFDVVAVGSGTEALARLATEPFDLLLVDGMMPGLDGPATAREIRRREAALQGEFRLPIVAITASGQPEDRERMLAAGIDDLVVKPVLDEDLDRALTRWLPSAGPRRETLIAARTEDDAWPQPEPRGDGPVIDEAAFARLAVLGDAAFVERMVRLFMADAEGRVTQVEEAVSVGDVARLRVALEALQSIAATVGATSLGHHAHEIGDEMRGREVAQALPDKPRGSMGLADDLEAARDRLRELLTAMRAQPAS